MMPAGLQLVPVSGHVEESEAERKLKLYTTSISTPVSMTLETFGTKNSWRDCVSGDVVKNKGKYIHSDEYKIIQAFT